MKAFFALFLALAACFASETRLGKPLTLKQAVAVDAVAAAPDKFVNKIVQVKGQVSEVCQEMGCWMMLVDPATKTSLRIKVNDGEIVFPKDAVGKNAIAEGKLVKMVLTKEQAAANAKHMAESAGKSFDPASVKAAQTIYQIAGTGAVIID